MDVASARTIRRALTVNTVRTSTMTCHGNQLLENRQMLVKVRAVWLDACKWSQYSGGGGGGLRNETIQKA